jgi:hypothetical protein
MVWAHFENEGRWKPEVDFECETKRKTPMRKTTVKMGTTGYERCTQKEGRTWEETGGALGKQR